MWHKRGKEINIGGQWTLTREVCIGYSKHNSVKLFKGTKEFYRALNCTDYSFILT